MTPLIKGMMMETLYVVEPGSYVKKSGNALNIMKQGIVLETIPAIGLEKLVLSGYVSLSGPVMDFLIRNRVETVFVTPTGRFRARLMIDEHKHVALRKAQYLKLSQEVFCLATMKIIVKGKLDNMVSFLIRRSRDYSDNLLKNAAAGLKSLGRKLDENLSKDAVRGIEGAGARIYFSVFKRLIRNSDFSFNGRNRRPPLDPVNALLSFVYTLLTNEVLSAIKICGLDPYLGALHEISYGRPSLACDLVEEYRCIIGDRLVLNLLNRKMIKPADFVFRNRAQKTFADEQEMKKQRPVEMKPYLYKTFLASYEDMMTGKALYRNLIRKQARSFSEYLNKSEERYQPIAM
ncbi:MAG: CRISPR-associated endonuclease Cas1 [Thermodesulfobacteriota bacterium]|nr:CRISPR-associated endonuclease Cas1 [Thermodesulfobacteriota bacterium]